MTGSRKHNRFSLSCTAQLCTPAMLDMAKPFSVVRVVQILLLLYGGNNLVSQKDELIDSSYFISREFT